MKTKKAHTYFFSGIDLECVAMRFPCNYSFVIAKRTILKHVVQHTRELETSAGWFWRLSHRSKYSLNNDVMALTV
jgi:hypothetical protein